MKAKEAKSTESLDKIKLFRQSVIYFLNKHKTSKRMLNLYKQMPAEEQLDLFEESITVLHERM